MAKATTKDEIRAGLEQHGIPFTENGQGDFIVQAQVGLVANSPETKIVFDPKAPAETRLAFKEDGDLDVNRVEVQSTIPVVGSPDGGWSQRAIHPEPLR